MRVEQPSRSVETETFEQLRCDIAHYRTQLEAQTDEHIRAALLSIIRELEAKLASATSACPSHSADARK